MRAVVRNPQPDDDETLREHLLDPSALRSYQQQFNNPVCPPDLSYTYGSRLRSYFGVDTLQECSRILRAEPGSRHAYISLWDSRTDFTRDTVPCMVSLFFRLYDDVLSLTATFRAHNAAAAWIQNVYGLLPIARWMADQMEVEPGPLVIISESISLRKSELDKVLPVIQIYERTFVQYREDPKGHFEIALDGGKIVVVQRSGGATVNRFEGTSAQTLEHHIARAAAVSEITHALYLGRELTRAEDSLKTGKPYVQK
jgi:thymidylate synthase